MNCTTYPIKIKAIPFDNERVRFLTKEDRDRLIGSYVAHVQPVITMLAFHGPRVQTALQIQWGVNGVDMEREAIRLNQSKNAVIQSVPMHWRVKDVPLPIGEDRGKPTKAHGFLNKHGQPFQDTRLAAIPGGNPLKRAHATALARAEIEDFTVHDWRHHWASHCVMAGIDLITIMHMGGWKALRMVQRYASVGLDHMRAAVAKLPQSKRASGRLLRSPILGGFPTGRFRALRCCKRPLVQQCCRQQRAPNRPSHLSANHPETGRSFTLLGVHAVTAEIGGFPARQHSEAPKRIAAARLAAGCPASDLQSGMVWLHEMPAGRRHLAGALPAFRSIPPVRWVSSVIAPHCLHPRQPRA